MKTYTVPIRIWPMTLTANVDCASITKNAEYSPKKRARFHGGCSSTRSRRRVAQPVRQAHAQVSAG